MDRTRTLLRNGTIVDGTGAPPRRGSLLLENGVQVLLPADARVEEARELDCQQHVIAPGFIDVHSHMDFFAVSDQPESFQTFAAQGITSMVVGNCGFSPFGFQCASPHHDLIENSLFKAGHERIDWHDFSGYREQIERHGPMQNLVSLVGHGTCRTSLHGFQAGELPANEQDTMLRLLDEAMEQGAAGVSLGLQYKPGVFARKAELQEVARLVRRRNKILTVHAKAYSIASGTYPIVPFGRPHNLRAIAEMLTLARETGVKLQFSHLIFAGARTWPTMDRALKMFDAAIADGVDVQFDIFPNSFGATLLNTLLPEWVMAGMPGVLHRRLPLLRLKLEAWLAFRLVGLGYEHIQIATAECEPYNQFNGLFVSEIAKRVGKTPFDVLVEILALSNAEARMLLHRYYDEVQIPRLMAHPAALFMTDAWPEPSGVQNASAFGAFPKFLSIARASGCLSLSEVVARMTGRAAERFSLKGRGLIQAGYAGDVVVFDWERVADHTHPGNPTAQPEGIRHVFINGEAVVLDGATMRTRHSGKFISV